MAPRRGELQAWIRRHATELEPTSNRRPRRCWPSGSAGRWPSRTSKRGEQTRIADGELRKLATYAGERPISVEDVEALVADTRPASLFAITNAIDRRDAQEPPPPSTGRWPTASRCRILGALQGRLSDLIVARDLGAQRHAGRAHEAGRARQRLAGGAPGEAARRYDGELETMLIGLFEADLAIKSNAMEPEPALVAWLGEFVIGMPRASAQYGARPRRGSSGGAGAQDAVALDGEGAACLGQPQDADQLLVHVQLAARHAQRAGDGEEEPLVGHGVLERGVEHAGQQLTAAEAAGLDRP